MPFCSECSEIQVCTARVALGKQSEYFKVPKYQNEQWITDFEIFIQRLEAFGCTNEAMMTNLQAAKASLAEAQKSILVSA